MLGWVETVDPGMRRFGFNPFGRDVADEVHADLLRHGGRRKHPPVRRPAGDHGRGRALPSTSTRSGVPLGRTVVEVGPLTERRATRGATQNCKAQPLRALNEVGARLARFGVTLPSLAPSSVVAAAAKAAGSADLGSDSYREPLEVFLESCGRRSRPDHVRPHPDLQDAQLGPGQPDRSAPMVAGPPRGARRAHRQPLGHRRAAPYRHERAVHVARPRSHGPAAAPVGGGPPHPATHIGRVGDRIPASPRRPRSSTG